MSIKYFHFVFVTAAWLLCFIVAAWALLEPTNEGNTAAFTFGIVAILAGLGLIVYECVAWRKLRTIYVD